MHLKYPFMGARMLRDQLAWQDIHVGRCHVGTLMHRMDIPPRVKVVVASVMQLMAKCRFSSNVV